MNGNYFYFHKNIQQFIILFAYSLFTIELDHLRKELKYKESEANKAKETIKIYEDKLAN